jgi:ubiquinone/menaquinone biosynthesis C-methylase UbiE
VTGPLTLARLDGDDVRPELGEEEAGEVATVVGEVENSVRVQHRCNSYPISDRDPIPSHYTSGELWRRLEASLADDGVDTRAPTIEELAPYDQFHGRGLEATVELADGVDVSAADLLLDVGSGLGGPARYMADRFGCRVIGVDLTAELCNVAGRLTALTGLAGRVSTVQASAVAMPFPGGLFDGAYSMNVTMNIADRSTVFEEIGRVLRPGGWFVVSEVGRGPNPGLAYPTPWARTERESFLLPPDETAGLLEAAGFEVDRVIDTTAAALESAARARELVQAGHKPPHRAIALVHGEIGAEAATNSGRGLQAGQVVPIEVHCHKPSVV